MSENESILNFDEENLNQPQALQILINAVHLGQSRGAWKLNETTTLIKAINTFINKSEDVQNNEVKEVKEV